MPKSWSVDNYTTGETFQSKGHEVRRTARLWKNHNPTHQILINCEFAADYSPRFVSWELLENEED